MTRLVNVGVGVLVFKDGLVLIGKRVGSHGAQCWSFPGGHVEYGEDPAHAATREVLEETGLTIDQPRALVFTSDIFVNEQKHYITLFYTAQWISGLATVLEPDRCLEWRWAPYNALPEPLFLPIQNLKKLVPEDPSQ